MSATTSLAEKVAAVVVTFHPDLERLSALLDATLPQVAHVYIVDNGTGEAIRPLVATNPGTSLLELGQNRGIAVAQNAGANAAIGAGANFILLLDQDSVPDRSMVQQLMTTYQLLVEQGHRIAAVGPRTPSRGDPGSFVTPCWFRYRETKPRGADSWVLCGLLIASGMLIPAHVFGAIGPMDETFFIDKVDTEWCLRAAALGYKLAGVPSAVLAHSLGDSSSPKWPGSHQAIAVHQPFRYYYMLRNSLLLMRRREATWHYRSAELRRLVVSLVYFSAIAPHRWRRTKMMWRGVLDGLLGRSGRAPDWFT